MGETASTDPIETMTSAELCDEIRSLRAMLIAERWVTLELRRRLADFIQPVRVFDRGPEPLVPFATC